MAITAPTSSDVYEHIGVQKVSASLGAEIAGVRLGGDVPDEAIRELRQALLTHKVVFLRDQQHADDEDQKSFAQRLGTLTKPHPTVAGEAGGGPLDPSAARRAH